MQWRIALLVMVLPALVACDSILHEVHSSSWSGSGRVHQFALSFVRQTSDVLECAALAAKHLLTDQLLVFIGGDATRQPQCVLDQCSQSTTCIPANRSGTQCRKLTPRTPQSPCCTRVFVPSLSHCWVSIQRRVDNSTDFYRNWSEYAAGFGDGPHTNHWIGLRFLHSLTWPASMALWIRMRLWNDTEYWADYSKFSVSSEAEKFRLNVSGFRSSDPNIGDCIVWSEGMMFSTPDSDNDADSTRSCSAVFRGSWWYRNCHQTNPNGLYFIPPSALATSEYAVGINWNNPFGYYYSMKEFEMLIY